MDILVKVLCRTLVLQVVFAKQFSVLFMFTAPVSCTCGGGMRLHHRLNVQYTNSGTAASPPSPKDTDAAPFCLLNVWATTHKADLKPLSGPRAFSYVHWRNDWVKVSRELVLDLECLHPKHGQLNK